MAMVATHKLSWYGSLKFILLIFIVVSISSMLMYKHKSTDLRLLAPSENASDVKALGKKTIYSASDTWLSMETLDFSMCPYSNCQIKVGRNVEFMKDGDMLLFQFNYIPNDLKDNLPERHKQLWVIYALESPGYWSFQWMPSKTTNRFNITMTYRPDSDVVIPYGRIKKLSSPTSGNQINYAAGKTKGAYAYVTNCDSVGYDRLGLMQQLKKYIDVDIYGGCTKNYPCPRGAYQCEDDLHKQYRFFLSFENSLCKDYITEKFWYRIKSSGIFIPVAMGGLSFDDYNKVAPPDSFLHVYNFTSISELGEYLKYLSEHDDAYNRYHAWRQHYVIEPTNYCDLCQLVNDNKSRPAYNKLADWWNMNTCRSFTINSSSSLLSSTFSSIPIFLVEIILRYLPIPYSS